MNLQQLFRLSCRFDPAEPGALARGLSEQFRRRAEDDELLARIAGAGSVVWDAAALTAYAVDETADTGSADGSLLTGVHRMAVLALLVDRHPDALVDPADSVSNALAVDLAALASAARGEAGAAAGPVSEYVVATREALASVPGWDAAEPGWSAMVADLLEGFAQEYRMRAVDRDDAFGSVLDSATRGGWLAAVIESAAVVAGDDSRLRHGRAIELVHRLAAGVLGLARDVKRLGEGGDDPRADDLVAARFALPGPVLGLSPEDRARALRATLELEVRDLLQALDHLGEASPRAGIVRRVVAATLELDRSTATVVAAVSGPRPDRTDLMGELRRVARADGTITTDERALLRGMDEHLLAFESLMERIAEDRTVDFEEFEQLRATRLEVMDDLMRIALADDEIRDDERQLLLRAMELLPTLR